MVRHRFLSRPLIDLFARVRRPGIARGRCGRSPPSPLGSGEFFAASVFSIDEILSRPFDREVPMGCTGDRVWASSPQGWAFRDDVQWLFLTNLRAFDLELRDEHGRLRPANATYFPSHIHYEGTARGDQGHGLVHLRARSRRKPALAPFVPEKRWTCWSSGNRSDWFEVDFGVPRSIGGFDLFFFDDSPSGECRPPAAFEVQYFQERLANGPGQLVQVVPERPSRGKSHPVRRSARPAFASSFIMRAIASTRASTACDRSGQGDRRGPSKPAQDHRRQIHHEFRHPGFDRASS